VNDDGPNAGKTLKAFPTQCRGCWGIIFFIVRNDIVDFDPFVALGYGLAMVLTFKKGRWAVRIVNQFSDKLLQLLLFTTNLLVQSKGTLIGLFSGMRLSDGAQGGDCR